jgi:hypothetical protein
LADIKNPFQHGGIGSGPCLADRGDEIKVPVLEMKTAIAFIRYRRVGTAKTAPSRTGSGLLDRGYPAHQGS